MRKVKRTVSLLAALVMLLSLFSSVALAQDKPDTWIADRVVLVQAYVDDIGGQLPNDQLSTPVMQELKKRTGMQIEFLYTPGENDRSTMTTQLATGNLPDMIVSYLNNSTRPEFPVLLSAARDGMFVDLAPFIKESKVYAKYLDKAYLPADTYENIVWRPEFNGAAYLMHLGIDAVDTSTQWIPEQEYVGGMYIQSAIVKDLNVDVKSIDSTEKLYQLLKDIKAKDYKDAAGNPVIPLGPKYWGGSADALTYVTADLNWGVSGNYNLSDDGQVLHEAQTEWAMKKVEYIRKLLDEGLMHKEFFTIDETRSNELTANKSIAVIGDIHNYKEPIYGSEDWVPLGPISDYRGVAGTITSGKSGYGAWAIPDTTANPEEVFKLMDYLASREGQMLMLYGVEGVSYDLADGKPVLKPEVAKMIADGDTATLRNLHGASFDGSGVYGLEYLLTDIQNETYFGEARPGAKSATTFDRAVQIARDYAQTYRLVPGLRASAFMTELPEVNARMSLLNYNEVLVQAAYSENKESAQQILDSFVAQLKQAGVEEFEALVLKKYQENPEMVMFY